MYVLISELKVYASHTTNYEYTIVDQYGNETTGTKESTVSLYDAKLENIAFHGILSDLKFGPLYRNWGQFGYIANEFTDNDKGKTYYRYKEDLDLEYLRNDVYAEYTEGLQDKDPEYFEDQNNIPNIDKDENAFVTMTPDAATEMWVGLPKKLEKGKQVSINGVGKTTMLSSRLDDQEVIAKDPMERLEIFRQMERVVLIWFQRHLQMEEMLEHSVILVQLILTEKEAQRMDL